MHPTPIIIFLVLESAGMARSFEEKLWVLQEKLKETDANLSVCIVLLQQYLRQEQYATKHSIAFFALVALAVAYPGGHEGGDGGGDHATAVIHGHPVVTHVFETPGIGHFHNYAPKIEGHLVTRGFGPHIYGHGHGH